MNFLCSLLLLIVIIATACRTRSEKLEPTLIDQIHEGTTTRATVEKLFGPPACVLTGANHKTLTLHQYQIARRNPGWVGAAEGNAGSIALRSLTTLYDTNQIVEKFLFDTSNTRVWRDRNQIFAGWSPAQADFSRIIKGITSRGEIIQWYGAPTMQTLTLDGNRVLCWRFIRKGKFRIQNRTQQFQVIFDADDFVKDFGVLGNTDAPPN